MVENNNPAKVISTSPIRNLYLKILKFFSLLIFILLA
jgi:hypothetical protein